MYYPNQSSASRRAGEDFLRRMNQCAPCTAQRAQSSFCHGCGESKPVNEGCHASGNTSMPSLAMVYAPIQEWTCLMETPEDALHHGTLFHELLKPFEGNGSRRSCKC